MPTLSVNQSTTDRLEVGKVLVLALGAASQCLVDVTSPNGSTQRLTPTASTTIGPFITEQTYRVTCALGSADVSEAWQDQVRPATLVTDASGVAVGIADASGATIVLSKHITSYQSAIPVSSPLDTVNNVLLALTVAANTMGPNGRLQIRMLWSFTNNANSKPIKVRFGGSVYSYNAGVASQAGANILVDIMNRGMTNVQIMTPSNVNGTLAHLTQPFVVGNVDTTQDQLLSFEVQKATGTDVAILEAVFVEIL